MWSQMLSSESGWPGVDGSVGAVDFFFLGGDEKEHDRNAHDGAYDGSVGRQGV